MIAAPDMRRCPYSIMVSTPALTGKIRPEQTGQVSPQPSPEPVARTMAPPRITSTVNASTAHAR